MKDLRNPSFAFDWFRKPSIECQSMELYHVLNRGVEKRTLFLDSSDYARFVHDMYEFNDSRPTANSGHRFHPTMKGFVNPSLERELVVDIHGWCLMKNHYHLLLSERVPGGLSLFIRKLNIGYANYFNQRYSRTGTLFQGRTKKKLIDSDAYFLHILNYIHLNPLDYNRQARDWRSRKIANASSAISHLKEYRWSSYLDYCGEKNFPSILTKDLFGDFCSEKSTTSYLKDIELSNIQPYTLE